MNGLIKTVRAIGAEFARRLYFPVFIAGLIAAALLIGIGIALIQVNAWWWILLGLIIFAVLVFLILAVVVRILIGAVKPLQTHDQEVMVRQFVDRFEDVAETVQTPKAVLLFQIVWDILRPTDHGLVKRMSDHATSSKREFQEIQKSFAQRS